MAKLKTQGTAIQRLNTTTSPNSWEDIAQVVNISGPGGSAPEIDVTALDSAAREYIIGLVDEGNISLDVIIDLATTSTLHAQLNTDRDNQSEQTFRIRLTDSPRTNIQFNAYVNERSFDISTDDAVRGTFGLRVTGALTIS